MTAGNATVSPEQFGSFGSPSPVYDPAGYVYFKAGSGQEVWAMHLELGSISKLSDFTTQSNSFFVQDIVFISSEVGIVFDINDQVATTRREKVAVTWRHDRAPIAVDGGPLGSSSAPYGSFRLGSIAVISSELSPGHPTHATVLALNITDTSASQYFHAVAAIDRSTGIGTMIAGVEGLAVQNTFPVVWRGSQGAARHGLMIMVQRSLQSPFDRQVYFWDGDVTSSIRLFDNLNDPKAGNTGDAFFAIAIEDPGVSPAVSSLAIGVSKERSGSELRVFQPAALAEGLITGPDSGVQFDPAPSVTRSGSYGNTQFTRSDGALCFILVNSTTEDMGCMVDGPRVSDNAANIMRAGAMPIHPLMDPASPQATSYSNSGSLGDITRIGVHLLGNGEGFVVYSMEYEGTTDTVYYFDGEHMPVELQGPAGRDAEVDNQAHAARAGNGRFIYYYGRNLEREESAIVADLADNGNITAPDSTVWEEGRQFNNKAVVLYDRFFVDVLKSRVDAGRELVIWDTQELAQGPQRVVSGDSVIDGIDTDDGPLIYYQPLPIIGGNTGEIIFGQEHESDDPDDDEEN